MNTTSGQVVRIAARTTQPARIRIDGEAVEAWEGESVLVAVLVYRQTLRRFEFADQWRAGFCLMGACQDCWVHIEGMGDVRACTTRVTAGMDVVTSPMPAKD